MPTKKTWILIAIAISGYIIGPLVGRWTAPVRVVTEVKTEEKVVVKEVETVKWKTETVYVQAKAVQTRVVTVEKPDGTKIKVEESKTEEKVREARQEAGAASRTNEVSLDRAEVATRTETRQSLNTLVLMGGINGQLQPVYGVSYVRNLIGPVGVGIWYMKGTDHRLGLNLSLQF